MSVPGAARPAARSWGGALMPPFSGPVRHLYVHVPFCRERCDYCDFASDAVGDPRPGAAGAAGEERERWLDRYVTALGVEWERERAEHGVRRLETLYFGGGTPSLLGPDRLERLLERFRPVLTPGAEVSVEMNPEDVDGACAAGAAQAGVRVSLGVQSFSPALRATLGRRATASPGAAYAALRAAGVANIGLDLIHCIPGESAGLLVGDIGAVLTLRPDHVSWYELDLAEGTALTARLRDAAVSGDPDDDAGAESYRRIVRQLSQAGYDWYEVSTSRFRAGGRATTWPAGAPARISVSALGP